MQLSTNMMHGLHEHGTTLLTLLLLFGSRGAGGGMASLSASEAAMLPVNMLMVCL